MVKKLLGGTVHELPKDYENVLLKDASAPVLWQSFTPLARNEWICWVISAKKQETRDKRILAGLDKMHKGMRRPCCWAGCPHR